MNLKLRSSVCRITVQKQLMMLLLCTICHSAVSQVQLERSVVASGGATASAPGLTISFTIGEPVTTTLSGGTSWLTQGFQQPDLISVGLWELPSSNVSISLYPNPFQNQLNFSVSGANTGRLYVEIFDIAGKTVLGREWYATDGIMTEDLKIDVGFLAPASYLVRVSNHEQTVSKVFNVIKTY